MRLPGIPVPGRLGRAFFSLEPLKMRDAAHGRRVVPRDRPTDRPTDRDRECGPEPGQFRANIYLDFLRMHAVIARQTQSIILIRKFLKLSFTIRKLLHLSILIDFYRHLLKNYR